MRDVETLRVKHASHQLGVAQASRILVTVAYLLALAVVAADAREVTLGIGALVGGLTAVLVALFSRQIHLACGMLAAHHIHDHDKLVDQTSGLVLLLTVAVLSGACAWGALVEPTPALAPLVAGLLFAWELWFYLYALALPPPELSGAG